MPVAATEKDPDKVEVEVWRDAVPRDLPAGVVEPHLEGDLAPPHLVPAHHLEEHRGTGHGGPRLAVGEGSHRAAGKEAGGGHLFLCSCTLKGLFLAGRPWALNR